MWPIIVGGILVAAAGIWAVMGLVVSRRLEPQTFALLVAVRKDGWTDENRARLNRFRYSARKAAKMASPSIRDMPIMDRRLDSMPWIDVLARLLVDLRKAESTEATQGHDQTSARFEDRNSGNQRPIDESVMGESPVARLKPDLLLIGISREKVESNDISFALSALVELFAKSETVQRMQGKVAILFEGYDDDSREVYEIPEVRRFCATLDQRFPYWLYFLTTWQDNLKVMTFCLVRVNVMGAQIAWVDPDDLQRFLISHLGAMNTVFDRYSLGEEFKLALTEQVCEYLSP